MRRPRDETILIKGELMFSIAQDAGRAVLGAARHALHYINHHTRPAHPGPNPRPTLAAEPTDSGREKSAEIRALAAERDRSGETLLVDR